MSKRILDACCGSRMFWFDKKNPDVEFVDCREFEDAQIWKSGEDGKAIRYCSVKPDTVADFTNLPFEDETFYLVVFDPPHLVHVGENSWLAKKYGRLTGDWQEMLRKGFSECMRVLKPNGTLVFKWSETDVSVREILSIIGHTPLFGHKSGKQAKTHWMCFMKGA